MPRIYKPNPRSKRYKKYDEALILEAVEEYRKKECSLKMVAEKFKIDKSVLYRHCTREMKKQGGQTVLNEETELYIIKYINICAEWGYPLDAIDLRFLVKYYLDKAGRTVLRFNGNLPGPDFVASFLKRHKDKISQRNSQNIKKNRAAVSPAIIKEYFSQLKVSLSDIDPNNIINFDETNLTDDPGRKKIITKRGTKYPERVMNHSKAAVSIMMAATATGELLPPYVVYKSQNIYDTWTVNGPPGTRYNRTLSGWFDAAMFEDWIKSIILPFFQNKEGRKCLIGDNLSSHLSLDVIRICQERNIFFVFLPANSTHLTQPLDVAFFRPMKIAWRNIILKWKKTDGKSQSTVPKGCFPKLLKKLIENLSTNAKDNIQSGFRKTGIHPLDEDQVLGRLPADNINDDKGTIEKSVLDILREMRYGTMNIEEPKRKKKINVIPGKSVGSEIEDYADTEEENIPNKKKKSNLNSTTAKKCKKTNEINKENKISMLQETEVPCTGKGKGKGKKTKSKTEVSRHEEKQKDHENNEINKENKIIIVQESEKPYAKGKGKGKIVKSQIEVSQQDEKQQDHENNYVIEEQNVNENFTLDCAELDLETMPILCQDILLFGEEVVTLPENIQSQDLECSPNVNHGQTIEMDVSKNSETNVFNGTSSEQEKDNIKILANELLPSDMTTKNKVVLKKCKRISAQYPVSISKSRVTNDLPSTSGMKIPTSRRPSYYKSDSEILQDLMDDST